MYLCIYINIYRCIFMYMWAGMRTKFLNLYFSIFMSHGSYLFLVCPKAVPTQNFRLQRTFDYFLMYRLHKKLNKFILTCSNHPYIFISFCCCCHLIAVLFCYPIMRMMYEWVDTNKFLSESKTKVLAHGLPLDRPTIP